MTAPTTTLQLGRIGQIAMPVHDMPKALAFYRDVLGLRFLFEAPPALAFFDCGGTRLMLSVPENPEFDHPGSILYFTVEDIQAAYEILKGRGADFMAAPQVLAKMPDHDLWMAFFRDGQRNVLGLMCEKRR